MMSLWCITIKTPSFSQTNQYPKYSRYSNLNRNVNTFSKKIKSKQKEITFYLLTWWRERLLNYKLVLVTDSQQVQRSVLFLITGILSWCNSCCQTQMQSEIAWHKLLRKIKSERKQLVIARKGLTRCFWKRLKR